MSNMSSSVKKILAILAAVLVVLIVIIIILASRDEVVREPDQMGETIIAEASARETEPETDTAAADAGTDAQPQEETTTQAEAVDLPNDKEVRLYVDEGGVMRLVTEYVSTWTPDADIAIFEAFNSDEPEIVYDDYYSVHQDYWDAVETLLEYKIGYELSFDADGEHKVITILDPSDIVNNPDLFMGDAELDEVTGYMGVWVYCDMGQTGTYVHLQPEDMTEGVLMTSIKLRPTPQSDAVSNFRLKAFSWSSDSEFDAQGHYIGTHGYEIPIINQ